MLGLARWIMRSTPQAMLVAALCALVPWLFWLAAATVGLVTLRRGMGTAFPVLIAAAIPAGWWWARGDVVPLTTILLVALMATVLRARASWPDMLMSGCLASIVLVQLGVFIPTGGTAQLLEQVRQSSAEVSNMLSQLEAQGINTADLTHIIIGGVTGVIVLLASTACLALARYWQAGLFNPGGFQQEFHQLRLTRMQLLLLVVALGVGILFGIPSIGMLAWIPLLVAGVALVHGFIGLKGMSGLWLVGFYILLFTTWPTILIVLLLALVDTFANFRARLTRSD